MGGDAALIGLDITARSQAFRIELERLVRFLERQETACMPDDVGIGDAAVLADHRRIGRTWIETAKQRLASRVLELPFRRSDVAIAVGDLAVVDEEGMDHSVAGEPVVVPARLELGIRPVAIEGALKIGRKLAGDFEVIVVLAAHRGVIAREV
jgi:hypothetical protein